MTRTGIQGTGPVELTDRPGAARAPAALTLLALAVAGMAVSVQQTLVLPLLPRLMTSFQVSVSAVTWVFTVSLLAGAVATPLLSRFGDMYGKKKMIMVTLGLLITGSVVCALSTSLGVLIAGRALQGFSAALIPLAIGTIRDTFPADRVTTAIGVVSATMGVGGTIGMLFTGVIADHTTSHHPVFWTAAVLGAGALALVTVCAPGGGRRAGGRPDILGALLLGSWLVCLLLGISQGNSWGWSSGGIIGLFTASAVLCAVWVAVELRVREPLVRLNLLVGSRSLSANLASLLLGFSMFAAFTLISNFVQTPEERAGYGLSGTVLDVGLYMLPSTLTMLLFSALAGRFEARLGAAYTLAIGSVFAALSYLWLAIFNDSVADMLVFSAVQGVGFGIAYAALGTLAVQHVPMSQSGIASGINSLVRTAGGSTAAAVTASVLTGNVIRGTTMPSLHGYVLCFVIAAIGAGCTAVVAAWHGMRHGRRATVAATA